MVKRGVDEVLDEHRAVYDQIGVVLDRVCIEIGREEVPKQYAALIRCTYMPQIGFLTAVPLKHRPEDERGHPAEAVYQHERWTLHFSTDSTMFFKNQRMHDL